MKGRHYSATKTLCAFFVFYFVTAFFLQHKFPVLVVAGEESPGTWMSGALLVMCAAIALTIGARDGYWPWSMLFLFFIVLALDERFMFHEQLKAHILFSNGKATPPLLAELPVVLGACLGAGVSFLLWQYVDGTARLLLIAAATLGVLSLILDIYNKAIFFEESFKLLAELSITCALLRKV